ncbi:transcription termination factor NusA [Massiliimalia massiliensis]|uniref:transcription termination factor NusA n=1 Tax=Massiliimalia massiliensis TaxID=1852384 RepID=UPI00098602BA|nr:transcription termination factor NusA [Massiliimalia massiliensis]
MNQDFFEALELLEAEKGIPVDSILDNIKNAINVAVRKYYTVGEDNVVIDINQAENKFKVSIVKDIVEEVEDEGTQISLEEALEKNKRAKLGGKLTIKLDTKQIGRIAAQSGKNLIHQAINDAVKAQMYEQYQSKLNEVVTATVQKVEPRTGNATVEIDKNEVILFKNEQIPGEALVEGQRIKVYVSDVVSTDRRCSIKVSRTHRDMVKRLFEQEVPEIFDGTVEVKAISREAGSRTKIAVFSKDSQVDPVGACIGNRGMRVANIVNELHGEKIDVVRYSENPEEFIAQALSPSDVLKVEIIDEENRICRVTVPDNQLSLAIGNKGQNAKLAARLTGYKIDIKPESGFYGEDEDEDAPIEI